MDAAKDVLTIIGGLAIFIGGVGGLYAYFKRGSDETTVAIQGREIASLTSYNAQLEKENTRLKAENEGLKRENDALKQNPITLDKIIKEVRSLARAVNKQSAAILKIVGSSNGK